MVGGRKIKQIMLFIILIAILTIANVYAHCRAVILYARLAGLLPSLIRPSYH
jgi:hypothetical protein